MTKRTAVACLLVAAALGRAVGAAEGDPNPPWSIRMSHGPLQVITVHYRDGSSATAYYLVLKLENKGVVDAPLSLQVKAVVGTHPLKRKVHLALPHQDAEEWVRRIARADDLKNVQELNRGRGVLKPGESARCIAVFGSFNAEWDLATVHVSGLEPRVQEAKVRQYGEEFTLAHRGWRERNERTLKKVGSGADWREFNALVSHDVLWTMNFRREGDEFAPQTDPIQLESEGWTVNEDPAPKIVMEIKGPYSK